MNIDLGEVQAGLVREIEKHCKSRMKFEAIDYLELNMLADAFVNWLDAAEFCNKHGNTYEMPTKTGSYPMIRPEYNVKKNEYQNILKHSGKFGLNPGDREKIFKKLKEEKEKKGFDTSMKVTKTA